MLLLYITHLTTPQALHPILLWIVASTCVCIAADQSLVQVDCGQNVAAPIMMVLDGCPSTKDHLLVVNTLMELKRDVCLVRMCVSVHAEFLNIRKIVVDSLTWLCHT